MVDFLLYAASLDASVATRSKISKHQIRCVTPSVNLRLLTVDKGVEDRHGAVGNASVRVNLLQDCRKCVSKHSNYRSLLQATKVTLNRCDKFEC